MNLLKPVELRKCKRGDQLLSIQGTILTYVGPTEGGHDYDHRVKYPDGSDGTRIHDGHVFRKHRLSTDEDIVKILPRRKSIKNKPNKAKVAK